MNGNLQELNKFIEIERNRFSMPDHNTFSACFSNLQRYYTFLLIIIQRYDKASGSFAENLRKGMGRIQPLAKAGHRRLTGRELRLLKRSYTLTTAVHLEIESFYLFGKILLDRVARALEFYFGPVRSRSLDSHDKLAKNLEDYAREKGLSISRQLMDSAGKLKQIISDHRDYEIAHAKNARVIFGTGIDAEDKTTILSLGVHLDDGEKQIKTKELPELLDEIDTYLTLVIKFIKTNQNKTQLKTVNSPSQIQPNQ